MDRDPVDDRIRSREINVFENAVGADGGNRTGTFQRGKCLLDDRVLLCSERTGRDGLHRCDALTGKVFAHNIFPLTVAPVAPESVLVGDHNLARQKITDEVRADGVKGTGLRSEDNASVLPCSIAERPESERITARDEFCR